MVRVRVRVRVRLTSSRAQHSQEFLFWAHEEVLIRGYYMKGA